MTDTTPRLEILNLTKRISGRRILKDFTYTFVSGTRYLLTGPNGSGKTTLLKLLAGLMRPTVGEIRYLGRLLEEWGSHYGKEVSLLSHELYMYEDLTGFENLEFFARLHGLPSPKKRALELLERVGLKFFVHEPVKFYSQGMKQRLAVAKAILHRPRVLLFDEPFSGLDLRGTELLHETLQEVLPRGDGIFILATHNPDLGWKLADQYLYLERGVLQATGDQAHFQNAGILHRLRQKMDVGVF